MVVNTIQNGSSESIGLQAQTQLVYSSLVILYYNYLKLARS
ncbi:hypothetical protein [Oscillatoria sp. FACHB-1407]|nr:hypothetical protein [Oscillatoria sp. FACHB-1407]